MSLIRKIPNWDKDFKDKGFAYYEFTGAYDLFPQ